MVGKRKEMQQEPKKRGGGRGGNKNEPDTDLFSYFFFKIFFFQLFLLSQSQLAYLGWFLCIIDVKSRKKKPSFL